MKTLKYVLVGVLISLFILLVSCATLQNYCPFDDLELGMMKSEADKVCVGKPTNIFWNYEGGVKTEIWGFRFKDKTANEVKYLTFVDDRLSDISGRGELLKNSRVAFIRKLKLKSFEEDE